LALAIAHGEEIMHYWRIFEINWGANRKILGRESKTQEGQEDTQHKIPPPPHPHNYQRKLPQFGS